MGSAVRWVRTDGAGEAWQENFFPHRGGQFEFHLTLPVESSLCCKSSPPSHPPWIRFVVVFSSPTPSIHFCPFVVVFSSPTPSIHARSFIVVFSYGVPSIHVHLFVVVFSSPTPSIYAHPFVVIFSCGAPSIHACPFVVVFSSPTPSIHARPFVVVFSSPMPSIHARLFSLPTLSTTSRFVLSWRGAITTAVDANNDTAASKSGGSMPFRVNHGLDLHRLDHGYPLIV
ncbi:hypothetical protein ACLOJK_018339 [Asimina triloba]